MTGWAGRPVNRCMNWQLRITRSVSRASAVYEASIATYWGLPSSPVTSIMRSARKKLRKICAGDAGGAAAVGQVVQVIPGKHSYEGETKLVKDVLVAVPGSASDEVSLENPHVVEYASVELLQLGDRLV